MFHKRTIAAAMLAGGMMALGPAFADHHKGGEGMDPIKKAVEDNSYRTEEQMARDTYRHPAETLAFFGIEPGMTVVEVLPGWYTEILGPLVGEQGAYIGAYYPLGDDEERNARSEERRAGFVDAHPALPENAKATFLLAEGGLAEPGSVDMILAFRATHGLFNSGKVEEVFEEYFEVLRPGGVLGVVQHREDADADREISGSRGYLKEEWVIDVAEKAGFELVAKSEINANPKDTKDYARGVWELPPVLAVSDDSLKDKHMAIGESDRMTLKFVKLAS